MELTIRDVEARDAAAVIGVLNPIIEAREYSAFSEPFSADFERDYIVNLSDRGVWKVATRATDSQLVGFQILEPYGPYTSAFDHVATMGTYVDLALRRQGIATALFKATLPAARHKGYEKIFTLVRADNPAALAAYRANGFEVVGTARRHLKIDGRHIDEILIERTLGPG